MYMLKGDFKQTHQYVIKERFYVLQFYIGDTAEAK